MLIATIDGNGSATGTHYIHTDHLTGSNVISNAAGAQEQLLAYYPFGETHLNEKTGSFDEQRKFTGHEHDGQTDLTYMAARYYPGSVGRFLSQDPAVLSIGADQKRTKRLLPEPQHQNNYSYVANNPLKYVDPTGEAAAGLCVSGGGGIPGIYGQVSGCGVVTVSLNPFNVEAGLIGSVEGGGSTALGSLEGTVGTLWSPNAESIDDLEGPGVAGGVSVRMGVAYGVDVETSKPNEENKRIVTIMKSRGIGGNKTPYVVPVEVHGGVSYSKSIWGVNITQSVKDAFRAVQTGIQSSSIAIQNTLTEIAAKIDTIQSMINEHTGANSK